MTDPSETPVMSLARRATLRERLNHPAYRDVRDDLVGLLDLADSLERELNEADERVALADRLEPAVQAALANTAGLEASRVELAEAVGSFVPDITWFGNYLAGEAAR